jgi:hypothetical protein
MMYLWDLDMKIHKLHRHSCGKTTRHARERNLSFVGCGDILTVLREVEAIFLAESERFEDEGIDVTTDRVEVVRVFRKEPVHRVLMCAEGEPQ